MTSDLFLVSTILFYLIHIAPRSVPKASRKRLTIWRAHVRKNGVIKFRRYLWENKEEYGKSKIWVVFRTSPFILIYTISSKNWADWEISMILLEGNF